MTAAATATIDRVELVEGYGIRWRGVGDGPCLVWAHDALSSIDHDDASGIIDFGAMGTTNRIVRFDAVGHGRSAGVFDPSDHEWEARGRTLVDLARQLELEHCAVGGFGAGAASALHAALLAPGRADRLVLAAPAAEWHVPGWLRRLPRPIVAGLLIGSAEPLRLVGRVAPVLHRHDPLGRLNAAGWRRLVGAPRNQFNAVLIGAARSRLPRADRLARIDVPALVLAYRGDPTHPVRIAERLAAALPDAELDVADDGDDVGAWGDRIADFLSG